MLPAHKFNARALANPPRKQASARNATRCQALSPPLARASDAQARGGGRGCDSGAGCTRGGVKIEMLQQSKPRTFMEMAICTKTRGRVQKVRTGNKFKCKAARRSASCERGAGHWTAGCSACMRAVSNTFRGGRGGGRGGQQHLLRVTRLEFSILYHRARYCTCSHNSHIFGTQTCAV